MYYQINRETQKLELIFDKAEYLALPDEKKREIKSNFLFSRAAGGWVSRAKWPNTYYAEQTAKSLGAENRGKTGEALSFADQMERKAERAEARAERMEASDYYRDAAQTARETAAGTKPKDKGFCERRMNDAEKTIRAQKKNLEHYKKQLEIIEQNGPQKRPWSDEEITAETVTGWIENAEEIMENAISKYSYYAECLEDLGGIQYSRENIKPGYVLRLKRWKREVTVINCGPKNFRYKENDGPSAGWQGMESYAEILEIISTEGAEKPAPVHPFTVGEKKTLPVWNRETQRYEDHEHEIIKRTEKTVTIRDNVTGNTVNRKPQLREGGNGSSWAVFVNDEYRSGFFRPATA